MRSLVTLALLAAHAPAADMSMTLVANTDLRSPLEAIPRTNGERADRLIDLFRARGCAEPQLALQAFHKKKPPNVVCTLPGQTGEEVVVGAHFDAVPGSAGALDNWAGAAMLPSLYAALASRPRRYTYVFVGFSAEEEGLYGSRAFVKDMAEERRERILAMVNLDCMGAGTTKIGWSRSDEKLSMAFLGIAKSLQIEAEPMSYDRIGSSDHESFRRAKIPVLTLHSLTQEVLPVIHTEKDQPELIRTAEYFSAYKLISAYLVYLQTHFAEEAVSK